MQMCAAYVFAYICFLEMRQILIVDSDPFMHLKVKCHLTVSHFDGAYFYRLDGIVYRHPASDGLATTLAMHLMRLKKKTRICSDAVRFKHST